MNVGGGRLDFKIDKVLSWASAYIEGGLEADQRRGHGARVGLKVYGAQFGITDDALCSPARPALKISMFRCRC